MDLLLIVNEHDDATTASVVRGLVRSRHQSIQCVSLGVYVRVG